MADDRNRYDDYDYGRDYGSGRDYTYSSARDYAAAGRVGRDDRNFRGGGTGYGGGDPRDAFRGGSEGGGSYGGGGRERWGRDDGERDYYGGRRQERSGNEGGGAPYRGSYGHDGRRFVEDQPRDDDRNRGWGRDRDDHRERSAGAGYGGAPQGYRYQDRGFFDRAGDEVRSWFGDEDAERRREFDQRAADQEENRGGRAPHDDHYHSWRRGQIAALDRDYDEYRREHATRFENEFGAWRNERQTQRGSLSRVTEHMEVIGSDGQHVGTVDKVRGDRILLTKNDVDAGGRHHSIPSRWIQTVDDKVVIRKTADEAKSHWRDEEQSGALFGDDHARSRLGRDDQDRDGRVDLNRSFSGTYKP